MKLSLTLKIFSELRCKNALREYVLPEIVAKFMDFVSLNIMNGQLFLKTKLLLSFYLNSNKEIIVKKSENK